MGAGAEGVYVLWIPSISDMVEGCWVCLVWVGRMGVSADLFWYETDFDGEGGVVCNVVEGGWVGMYGTAIKGSVDLISRSSAGRNDIPLWSIFLVPIK